MPQVRISMEWWYVKLRIKKFGISESKFMDEIDIGNNPSPSIMAQGLGGVYHSQYWIEDGKPMTVTATDKPAYNVPTMAEIASIPWNGLTVASTFSGCGGSFTCNRME